jgi:hypothetical protein
MRSRQKLNRRGSSPKDGLSSDAALTRHRSGDAEVLPVGPRAAPHRGGLIEPAHG